MTEHEKKMHEFMDRVLKWLVGGSVVLALLLVGLFALATSLSFVLVVGIVILLVLGVFAIAWVIVVVPVLVWKKIEAKWEDELKSAWTRIKRLWTSL